MTLMIHRDSSSWLCPDSEGAPCDINAFDFTDPDSLDIRLHDSYSSSCKSGEEQQCRIPEFFKYEYCLSHLHVQRCKLRASMPILLTVIVANILKALCIAWSLFQKTPVFVTLGDSICNFLTRPDQFTRCASGLDAENLSRRTWKHDSTVLRLATRRRLRLRAVFPINWACCNGRYCTAIEDIMSQS